MSRSVNAFRAFVAGKRGEPPPLTASELRAKATSELKRAQKIIRAAIALNAEADRLDGLVAPEGTKQ